MDLKDFNGIVYVSAKELHSELEIKKDFSTWIKDSINAAMLEEKDFFTFKGKSTGGRPSIDYMLKKIPAISVAVMSRGKNAKAVRDKILELYEQHDTGKAFTQDQILALIDISKSLVLVSIQKNLERKHFDLYGNKRTWWEYRAYLTGVSVSQLQEAMAKVNKKFKNKRQALLKLNPHELIRIGVIDLFKTLGKTDEYAQNVGNVCKNISEKINVMTDFFDDTKQNPLGIKQQDINNRKQLFKEFPIRKIYFD